MRLGEIEYVNIIPDASAVTCRVVVAEDENLFALAYGHLKHERNQVKFRVVIFAPGGSCSGGVEVAQARVAHAVDPVQPMEHALKNELRLAVWTARNDAFRLVDGHAL